MDHPLSPTELKSRLASLLAEARERTMLLIEPLSGDDLVAQHDPLMSPILWDLGHIAHFEELWLTRNLDGPIEFSEMPGMYNPFENPRSTRASLPLMPMEQVKQKFADIRGRVLEKLESVELRDDNPLLKDGFVYHMVLQHEYQHNETILQTLQLKQGDPYRAPRSVQFGQVSPQVEDMVRFPGGQVTIGTSAEPSAYDNERPMHGRTIAPFRIDRFPVTNRRYLEFVRDGGYSARDLWSDEGWEFIGTNGIKAPKYWVRSGDGWTVRSMDLVSELDPVRPVCHVCYHEAEAFAKWAGVRLPTEFEWEAAASWNPAEQRSSSYPWGDGAPDTGVANVDQLAFGTAPIGTYESASPTGCRGMIGDVWEWTLSDFGGYPGFEAFPYSEYSEVFFGGEYKVLRGGSWATRPGAIRNTFRNWDYPIRRQIFSGFRCAADD